MFSSRQMGAEPGSLDKKAEEGAIFCLAKGGIFYLLFFV
jgi:hypothetical protein